MPGGRIVTRPEGADSGMLPPGPVTVIAQSGPKGDKGDPGDGATDVSALQATADDLVARTAVLEAGRMVMQPRSASFTLAAGHEGVLIEAAHATVPIVVTVPPHAAVAFAAGAGCEVLRLGAAAVSFAAGAGVTILSLDGLLTIAAVGTSVALVQTSTQDTWVLAGALA